MYNLSTLDAARVRKDTKLSTFTPQDVVHVTPCDSMWPAMYSQPFQFLLTNATAIFSSVTGQENVQLATHTYYMHDQISTTTDQTW